MIAAATPRSVWALAPQIHYLNHGSFGACPQAVLTKQAELRARLESQPVRFFTRELPTLLDEARGVVARHVGADPADLVFVRNATEAVNAVLRSLPLQPGDELLTTDHAYNACRNVLQYCASASGARVVVAEVPFPIADASLVVERVLAATSSRTRLVLLDHVTSPTALVFPVAELVRELDRRGIDTLVDGAHAFGMLPLSLDALGAAWYTANCHKWGCAPKGAAFLHVRRDRRDALRPAVISHGANLPPRRGSRLQVEFDWTGTDDPTALLSVPAALRCMDEVIDGGWPSVMRRNHALALRGRAHVAETFAIEPPCPDGMVGSMASIPLPGLDPDAGAWPYTSALHDALVDEDRIEVPIVPWKGRRLVRISAQLYNDETEYVRLAERLRARLG